MSFLTRVALSHFQKYAENVFFLRISWFQFSRHTQENWTSLMLSRLFAKIKIQQHLRGNVNIGHVARCTAVVLNVIELCAGNGTLVSLMSQSHCVRLVGTTGTSPVPNKSTSLPQHEARRLLLAVPRVLDIQHFLLSNCIWSRYTSYANEHCISKKYSLSFCLPHITLSSHSQR